MFDFNLGYFGTAILGICFIGVGYFTIYNSSEILSESSAIFSDQLIRLYTDNLGDWSYYLIAFAALSTMLSTTITALDASPRAMGITTNLILNKEIKATNYQIDTYKKKIYVYGIALTSDEKDLVVNEAKEILDVEDVIASILIVDDLRIQKN